MAYTAHQDEETMVELEEDENMLNEHARKLANLIRDSRHFIIFTGAGKVQFGIYFDKLII